ncbi:hypothetical protein CAGA_24690 [Caproiciproducens galactitolivorans]|uniref:Uncharacterized protein n=1 Tax=Caproiciproducens galactitolivorans TaxID=642589 RepID=A0A4Z0Y7U0_9FIRM|nr:hypothetical protein CAGA_24690 [Caproiciproducens galactitolivorans]
MEKKYIWVFSLAVLLVIAFATHWGIIIRSAVILNALIILYNVAKTLYRAYRTKEKKC